MADPSKLINDLHHVPDIIASLGLGIAEAQRRMDLAYVQSLERIVVLAQALLGGFKADAADPSKAVKIDDENAKKVAEYRAQISDLLIKLAPARYQFTRTTLAVNLDLAQSLDAGGSFGLSAGVGAVAVNAALSVTYGYDYRAAARCETTLEAVLPDPAAFRVLLDSANTMGKQADKLELPALPTVDKAIHDQTTAVFERMAGFLPAPITEKTT
jgi:hypothetical protein